MARYSPAGFFGTKQNVWFYQLWQHLEAAKQPYAIKRSPPSWTVCMMFFLWNAVLALHWDRNSLLTCQSTDHYSKKLDGQELWQR